MTLGSRSQSTNYFPKLINQVTKQKPLVSKYLFADVFSELNISQSEVSAIIL